MTDKTITNAATPKAQPAIAIIEVKDAKAPFLERKYL